MAEFLLSTPGGMWSPLIGLQSCEDTGGLT